MMKQQFAFGSPNSNSVYSLRTLRVLVRALRASLMCVHYIVSGRCRVGLDRNSVWPAHVCNLGSSYIDGRLRTHIALFIIRIVSAINQVVKHPLMPHDLAEAALPDESLILNFLKQANS